MVNDVEHLLTCISSLEKYPLSIFNWGLFIIGLYTLSLYFHWIYNSGSEDGFCLFVCLLKHLKMLVQKSPLGKYHSKNFHRQYI